MAALCCTILLAIKTRVFTKTGSGQTSEKLRGKGRFLQGTHAWNALLVGAKRWVMFHPSTPAALLSPWAGKFKRLPPDCKAGVAGEEGEGEDDWEDLWGWYAKTPLFWSLFIHKNAHFTKTGSGQTLNTGKTQTQETVFSQVCGRPASNQSQGGRALCPNRSSYGNLRAGESRFRSQRGRVVVPRFRAARGRDCLCA